LKKWRIYSLTEQKFNELADNSYINEAGLTDNFKINNTNYYTETGIFSGYFYIVPDITFYSNKNDISSLDLALYDIYHRENYNDNDLIKLPSFIKAEFVYIIPNATIVDKN
jgi:hypothetical protein